MELSERWIQRFEDEGFPSVYEQQDGAGTIYPEQVNEGKKSIFVTDGSIIFDFNGETKEVIQNQRFDVPVGAPYTTTVGPNGLIAIIAEDSKSNS